MSLSERPVPQAPCEVGAAIPKHPTPLSLLWSLGFLIYFILILCCVS